MDRFDQLRASGASIWLDTLSRELLEDGGFDRLRRERAVTGATSNPTIFAKAICGSDRYDRQLEELLRTGTEDPGELFLALAIEDVRRAARALESVHAASGGSDGFVSLEVTPDVAHDGAATVAQALDLWRRLDAPNVMIKLPATEAGVTAIGDLTAAGVNVNVTLLFGIDRYGQVIEAYLRGLERRAAAEKPVDGIRSVASFFVSRVDAKADRRLPEDSPLRGRVGLANARAAYERYRSAFAGERWRRLEELGATRQRPLWASTAPKDPSYRDVLYLEELALPDTILTVPEPTLEAFADHGAPRASVGPPDHGLEAIEDAIDLASITTELEREGVEAFCAAYRQLRACIEHRVDVVRAGSRAAAAGRAGAVEGAVTQAMAASGRQPG